MSEHKTVYKIAGRSIGPKPEKKWEEPFGRKFTWYVTAENVTMALEKLVEIEEKEPLTGKLNNYHKNEYDEVPVKQVIVETLEAICPLDYSA